MAATRYARATDIRRDATWSIVSGTAQSQYPLSRLDDPRPDRVFKLQETSGAIRATFAAPVALEGIALVNLAATGPVAVTTNGAMGAQDLVIPAAPIDGLSRNAWVDLRAVTAPASQWTLTFPTHAAPIALGNVLLLETVRDILLSWEPGISERKVTTVHRTGYGVPVGGGRGVRVRTLTPRLDLEEQRAAYTDLRRSSSGPLEPFFVEVTYLETGPLYVWFPDEEWTATARTPGLTRWSDRLEELHAGLGL